jgi:hypothetical protein
MAGGLFAELGHSLAYALRRPADVLPTDPAHAYFRLALESALTALAAGLLVCLLLLGLARLLRGRVPRSSPGSFALLFTCLLAVQMVVFLVQEGVESGVAPGIGTIALGLVGQQPVALAGALALRWLSARVPAAVRELVERPLILLAEPAAVPAPLFVQSPVGFARRFAAAAASRGPPVST